MPVQIVEVMNNTSGLLHYTNQESNVSFNVNPTPQTNPPNSPVGDGGYISTSTYNPDTVPYKSSDRSIIVTVDGGPQFSVCDDYYHFSVIGNSKPQKLTGPFNNGDKFVMKVDNDDVSFIKYDEGLRTTDLAHVPINSIPAVLGAIANAILTIKF